MSTRVEFIHKNLEALTDSDLRRKLNVILESINDWPTEIKTFEEFCDKVELFLGTDVTKEKIDLNLKHIDYNNYAWEAESLSQLIMLFDLYENGVNLNEIIIRLNAELQSKN